MDPPEWPRCADSQEALSALLCQLLQVTNPIVVVQTPRFPPGMGDVFEVGHAGVVVPDLATPPGANVENMIEGCLYYPAVTDRNDYVVQVLFDQLFDKQTCAGAEVDIRFSPFKMKGVTVENGRSLAQ